MAEDTAGTPDPDVPESAAHAGSPGAEPAVGSEDWFAELRAWDAVAAVRAAGADEDDELGDDEDVDLDDEDDDEFGPVSLDWETADPGCPHPWYRLDFVSEGTGLGCSRCGYGWILDEDEESAEALLVVWQAARMEFDRLVAQQAALTAVVEELSGKRHCVVCDTWDAPGAFVAIAGVHACPRHVGALVAQAPEPTDLVEEAADWLDASGLLASPLVYDQWLAEANILDFTDIGVLSGRDDTLMPTVPVTVSEATAHVLGTEEESTVGDVTSALAALLDLDSPSCRPSWTFLLGLVAHAGFPGPDDAGEAALAAIPGHGTYRAVIVMDLCRSDMTDDVTFTGDMADDLVLAIANRAVEALRA